MSDISITYDLLFDVLRTEKSRDDLQKLEDKFYNDVVSYINSKESIIKNPNTPHGERELTRIQLGNVKKILIELYDRREKKIINLAIYKIKTGSHSLNTEGLLPEEKYVFNILHDKLSNYRNKIIYSVIEGKALSSLEEDPSPVLNTRHSFASSNDDVDDSENISETDANLIRSIRFTKSVPKFLGPELETYGPFEENDIASLPSKIANILIKKSRAEEMNVN